MSQVADTAPVTVVVQTRVREAENDAFGRWQSKISATVAKQPGFIEQSVMPPNPPTQTDWVILQRFSTADSAIAWLRADLRQQLVAEAQHMLIGVDDVHLLRDPSTGVVPAPVSAVITTRVKPGQETGFRAWEQRIAKAQARSPGFQGYRFEPPIPGVQDDWLAILRFDNEQHLQVWLDSPERHTLLREAEPFIEEFHARVVRSGFEQWFTGGDGKAASAPVWKQNMVVLLMLYPVVFLFGRDIQTPYLMGSASLPFWAALFIGNIVSVVSLNWLIPWACQPLGWWLNPSKLRSRRVVDIAGAAVLCACYAVWLSLFFLMSYTSTQP